MTPRAKLGYTAAVLTVVAAILTPFMLFDLFTKGFVGLGFHVDEMYSGGEKVRTIENGAYTIAVHRAVFPHMLQNEKPFVQMDWSPVNALPGHVSDMVDVDGDGQPDVRVSFDVPNDPRMPLHVNLDALNSRYEAMNHAGKEKYSRLIVRVDDRILVRVPIAKP
jgi:hypothetical protein